MRELTAPVGATIRIVTYVSVDAYRSPLICDSGDIICPRRNLSCAAGQRHVVAEVCEEGRDSLHQRVTRVKGPQVGVGEGRSACGCVRRVVTTEPAALYLPANLVAERNADHYSVGVYVVRQVVAQRGGINEWEVAHRHYKLIRQKLGEGGRAVLTVE